MTDQDREFLESLCAHLEEWFPGVTAGFEGLVTPYLGGERDGFLVVEAFNVPGDRLEEVLCAGEALAFEHLEKGGAFVTFSLWTPGETREHFLEDVAAQRRERLRRLVSTVYGTLEPEAPLSADVYSYWEASFRSFEEMGERLEEVVLSSLKEMVPNWVTISSERSDSTLSAYVDVWHDLFDVSARDDLALPRREAESASAANESLALAA